MATCFSGSFSHLVCAHGARAVRIVVLEDLLLNYQYISLLFIAFRIILLHWCFPSSYQESLNLIPKHMELNKSQFSVFIFLWKILDKHILSVLYESSSVVAKFIQIQWLKNVWVTRMSSLVFFKDHHWQIKRAMLSSSCSFPSAEHPQISKYFCGIHFTWIELNWNFRLCLNMGQV